MKIQPSAPTIVCNEGYCLEHERLIRAYVSKNLQKKQMLKELGSKDLTKIWKMFPDLIQSEKATGEIHGYTFLSNVLKATINHGVLSDLNADEVLASAKNVHTLVVVSFPSLAKDKAVAWEGFGVDKAKIIA